jgi:TPR repeat protein
MAESGDPESQLYIGCFHANGDIVEQDFAISFSWFKKAAEKGNARAQYYLGLLYESGVGIERNFREAFTWYMAAVRQDDAAAHLGIAGFHFAYRKSHMPIYFGEYDIWRSKALFLVRLRKLTQSYEESFWNEYNKGNKYFLNDISIFRNVSERAKNGDAEAQLYLAKMFLHAQGVRRDYSYANKLIKIAADNHNFNALFMLGAASDLNSLVEPTRTSFARRRYLSLAAKSPDEPFFKFYFHDSILTDIRRRESFRALNNSELNNRFSNSQKTRVLSNGIYFEHLKGLLFLANNGYVFAQYRLAQLLMIPNPKEAFGWAMRAAQNGHSRSKILIGAMYWFGRGTTRDFEEGKKWLDETLTALDGSILFNLRLAMSGTRNLVPEIIVNLEDELLDSYNSGDSTAALYLGLLIRNNKYSKLKEEDPQKWYMKSIQRGTMAGVLVLLSDIARTGQFTVSPLIKNLPDDSDTLKDFSKMVNLMENNNHINRLLLLAIERNYLPAVFELMDRTNNLNYDFDTLGAIYKKYIFVHSDWFLIRASFVRFSDIFHDNYIGFIERDLFEKHSEEQHSYLRYLYSLHIDI